MNQKTLWINRILCGVVCAIVVWICEKYNLRPAWCFILAFLTLIGLTFGFEIVKYFFK
jgi:hypothetical protein